MSKLTIATHYMSQDPLCPNLTNKFQKEVSQMANRNLSCVILLGGLSVNLNHLKKKELFLSYNEGVKSLNLVLWKCSSN